MNTSQPQLIATPQFDSGRWKLRLEGAPIQAEKQQSDGPTGSNVAVGITLGTPMIWLIAAYLWSQFVA